MLFESGPLRVLELTDEDAPYLVKWMSDPEVLQFYTGRDRPQDMGMVREIFYEDDGLTRCIIEYDSVKIGYIQLYELEEEEKIDLGYAGTEEKMCGADQFIGETSYWNKEIGQFLVNAAVDYLITKLGASKVVMEPQTRNVRAIACYEKCGFRKVRILPKHEWHEGEMRDQWVMEYSK